MGFITGGKVAVVFDQDLSGATCKVKTLYLKYICSTRFILFEVFISWLDNKQCSHNSNLEFHVS